MKEKNESSRRLLGLDDLEVQPKDSQTRIRNTQKRLSLGVLRRLARFMKSDFLAFNFSGITRHETCFSKCWPKTLIITHQGSGNPVANSARLTRTAATYNPDIHINFIDHLNRI